MTIRGPSGTRLMASTHRDRSIPVRGSDAEEFKSLRAAQNPRAAAGMAHHDTGLQVGQSGQPPKDEGGP